MVQEHPINCPKCGEEVTTQENIVHLYMPHDIICPKCGTVVVKANNPLF